MLNRMFAILGLVLAVMVPAAALADDWVAVKLRGQVLQLVDGQWAELDRGDVVPDDRVIRTGANGRVDFRRDRETISLGADTQIQIHDRTGERFTTVQQHFGTVEIEAEVRNVQHFAVETPLLAAVVKGTRFVVRSGKSEASVQVKRGKVEVTDSRTGVHALVPSGQTATVSSAGGFVLEGRGAKSTPVLSATGEAVAAVPGSAGSQQPGVAAGVNAPAGVSAGVAAGADGVEVEASVGDVVDVGASVGAGGVSAGASVGSAASAGASVDDDGVEVGASVGGTSVGVSLGGGGGGVSLSLGGKKLL